MVGVQYSKVAPFQEMLTEITKKAAYRCTTWRADVHGGSGCRVDKRRPKHRPQRVLRGRCAPAASKGLGGKRARCARALKGAWWLSGNRLRTGDL